MTGLPQNTVCSLKCIYHLFWNKVGKQEVKMQQIRNRIPEDMEPLTEVLHTNLVTISTTKYLVAVIYTCRC